MTNDLAIKVHTYHLPHHTFQVPQPSYVALQPAVRFDHVFPHIPSHLDILVAHILEDVVPQPKTRGCCSNGGRRGYQVPNMKTHDYCSSTKVLHMLLGIGFLHMTWMARMMMICNLNDSLKVFLQASRRDNSWLPNS